MSLPKPKNDLTGHCSVIHENTLYVFSPYSFQSLELKEGAEWQELDMGLGATGASCVKAVSGSTPENDALFVVGGTPVGSAEDYPGIQRYSFAEKSWKWIFPADWVTQNRNNHAAAYLNSTQQILVYAGSQTTGDTGDSSATFLISATEPHTVTAFSSNAPPAYNPMLLPFNETHVMMIGGNANNQQVFLFSPETQWQELPVQLTSGIADQSTVQCTLVTGEDGSKVLETFNLGVSPNEVSRTVLVGADGLVAQTGTTVGVTGQNAKRVTLDSWPTYNNTYASTTTRTDYSIATDGDGFAVITGGNADEPFVIFDQQRNSWVNASTLFAGSQVVIQSEPSATESASTPTATQSSPVTETPAAAAAASSNNRNRMLTVLGATLGTIFGIAAVLIIILLLLRYKREKNRRAADKDYIEKDRLSFADRGDGFVSDEHPASQAKPWQQPQNNSHDSLAIISGRSIGGHKRGMGDLGSGDSMAALAKNPSPFGYNDDMEMSKLKEVSVSAAPVSTAPQKLSMQGELNMVAAGQPPPQGASRSSGWSRYFSGNEATNLASMESQRSTYASDRTSGNSESRYTGTESRLTTTVVPPLDLNFNKFEAQRLSRVATGSPTLGHSTEHLPGQSAQLARANSDASSVSEIGERQGNDHWSPIGRPDWQRPVSSTYTDSNRGSQYPIPSDNTSSVGTSSFNVSSFYHASNSDENLNKQNSAIYTQPPVMPAEARDSTVTVFPRGVPSVVPAGAQQQQQGKQNDMSWLNLGVTQ